MSRAAFFETDYNLKVTCGLCPKRCVIAPGKRGTCRTRINDGGDLRVLTHGRLLAAAVDPIEKKPLHHYRPASKTFSVATAGCNLTCPYCQNHSLSQKLCGDEAQLAIGATPWSPRRVVDAALASGCRSVAFTYSEPTLCFEFAAEMALVANSEGIEIVFVTNGQICAEPLAVLGTFLGAANVDLKILDKEVYRRVLGGDLDATLATIEGLHGAGVWVEVTTLVIPGFNDGDQQLRDIADHICSVDPHIPWHVSRFHPDYLWTDRPPTPVSTLARAHEIGVAAGLKNVYTGNIPGHAGEKTRCTACGTVVIDRVGYRISDIATQGGNCRACGEPIAGVGFP